jgi:hypothetical protein
MRPDAHGSTGVTLSYKGDDPSSPDWKTVARRCVPARRRTLHHGTIWVRRQVQEREV